MQENKPEQTTDDSKNKILSAYADAADFEAVAGASDKADEYVTMGLELQGRNAEIPDSEVEAALASTLAAAKRKRRRVRLRRRLIAVLAAAALLTALAITSFGGDQPFERFGYRVRDLLGLENGRIGVSGADELVLGDAAVRYDSYEELVASYGVELYFNPYSEGVKPFAVSTGDFGDCLEVSVSYHRADGTGLWCMSVQRCDGEQKFLHGWGGAHNEKYVVGNHTMYITPPDDYVFAAVYINGYIYQCTAYDRAMALRMFDLEKIAALPPEGSD